jgi:hypothetical protein
MDKTDLEIRLEGSGRGLILPGHFLEGLRKAAFTALTSQLHNFLCVILTWRAAKKRA